MDPLLDGRTEHIALLLHLGSTALKSVNEREGESVHDLLDLAEDRGDWSSDDGDGGEEPGFTDQSVEENLVDADELAESVEDEVGLSAGLDFGHSLHHGKSSRGGRDDVAESEDDFLSDEC